MNAIRIQHADQAKSKVKLADVRTNGGTQSRADINPSVVEDYAAAILDGAEFPKMIIFYDGTDHWLADGFHRHAAYLKAGIAVVEADVRQGTQRDAILFSVGANSSHGLRRTNDDKRRAVLTLLQDAEWSQWSDREVARRCAVSDFLVRSLRENRSEERVYTTKHGTISTMQTANIGGKSEPEGAGSFTTFSQNPPTEGNDVDEEEITAEDLAADPGFQSAVEAFANAKTLYDEAIAAPGVEPPSPELAANMQRMLGTQEQRSTLLRVVNMAKAVADLPPPADMVTAVPPALNHTINITALRAAADWFNQFAGAWERTEGANA